MVKIVKTIKQVDDDIIFVKAQAYEAFAKRNPKEAREYIHKLQALDRERESIRKIYNGYDFSKSESD